LGASFLQCLCESCVSVFAQQLLFAGDGDTFACAGSKETESAALNAAQMMPRISIFIERSICRKQVCGNRE
jgi:hypothetical protein